MVVRCGIRIIWQVHMRSLRNRPILKCLHRREGMVVGKMGQVVCISLSHIPAIIPPIKDEKFLQIVCF